MAIKKNVKRHVVRSINGGQDKAEKLKNEIRTKAKRVVVKSFQDGATFGDG